MEAALILRFIDSLRFVESSISHQGEGTEIDDRSHRCPPGFLPIDPRLPTGLRGDDMGRKARHDMAAEPSAGMTWAERLE